MILDCYDFYLWTIGELTLSPEQTKALLKELKLQNQNENESEK